MPRGRPKKIKTEEEIQAEMELKAQKDRLEKEAKNNLLAERDMSVVVKEIFWKLWEKEESRIIWVKGYGKKENGIDEDGNGNGNGNGLLGEFVDGEDEDENEKEMDETEVEIEDCESCVRGNVADLEDLFEAMGKDSKGVYNKEEIEWYNWCKEKMTRFEDSEWEIKIVKNGFDKNGENEKVYDKEEVFVVRVG